MSIFLSFFEFFLSFRLHFLPFFDLLARLPLALFLYIYSYSHSSAPINTPQKNNSDVPQAADGPGRVEHPLARLGRLHLRRRGLVDRRAQHPQRENRAPDGGLGPRAQRRARVRVGGKKSSANPDVVPSLVGAKTLQVAMGASCSLFLVERGHPAVEALEVWSPKAPDVEEAAVAAEEEGGMGEVGRG